MQTTDVLLLLILIILLVCVSCFASKILLDFVKIQKDQQNFKSIFDTFVPIFTQILTEFISKNNPAPPGHTDNTNPFANMFANGQNPFTGVPLDESFFERFRQGAGAANPPGAGTGAAAA